MARKRQGRGWLAKLLFGDPEQKKRDAAARIRNRQKGLRALEQHDRWAKQRQRQLSLDEKRAERARVVEERKLTLERAALAKARQKAAREEARARKLEEQANRARTRSKATEYREKADTARRKVDHVEETAARIERGEYTPSELKELMASGALRLTSK